MTSMLLILVALGVFIHSSEALKCHSCYNCDEPSSAFCDLGNICVKYELVYGGAPTIC